MPDGRLSRCLYAEPSIADSTTAEGRWSGVDLIQPGQSGDPATLARALIPIASQEPPPRRFIAGADAIATTEQKIADLKALDRREPGPLDVARL